MRRQRFKTDIEMKRVLGMRLAGLVRDEQLEFKDTQQTASGCKVTMNEKAGINCLSRLISIYYMYFLSFLFSFSNV